MSGLHPHCEASMRMSDFLTHHQETNPKAVFQDHGLFSEFAAFQLSDAGGFSTQPYSVGVTSA